MKTQANYHFNILGYFSVGLWGMRDGTLALVWIHDLTQRDNSFCKSWRQVEALRAGPSVPTQWLASGTRHLRDRSLRNVLVPKSHPFRWQKGNRRATCHSERKASAGGVSDLFVGGGEGSPFPNLTNQHTGQSRGETAMNSSLSQVCDWLQNAIINHPNKHLKSKSKAIKTLLTLSLLPQANHKRPEFTTFAGGGRRTLGFKNKFISLFLILFFPPFLPLGQQ